MRLTAIRSRVSIAAASCAALEAEVAQRLGYAYRVLEGLTAEPLDSRR
jgi:hypothetical protein